MTVQPESHENYSYNQGLICYKGRLYIGSGGEIRQKLLQHMHASALGGHSRQQHTYQRIKQVFFWPGLKKDVEEIIRNCTVCIQNKLDNQPYVGLLQPLPVPQQAWNEISLDFVEGLPRSEGKDSIIVVIDRFTKYAHFIALTHPYTASEVAKAFFNTIYRLHGLPEKIISDRDRIFTSDLWQELFKIMGTKLHMSSSYHPQTDGQTERLNRCLETYLRCMCSQHPKAWH